MHEPYLILFVDGDALHVGKKLPNESTPREMFDISLSQLKKEDFDKASTRVGATVLGILKLWHKEAFKSWGSTVENIESSSSNDFEVALSLIDRFSCGASEDRLSLIDEILSNAAEFDSAASTYLRDDWPPLRKRLLRA